MVAGAVWNVISNRFGWCATLVAVPAVVLAVMGWMALEEDRETSAEGARQGGQQMIDELRAYRDSLQIDLPQSSLQCWPDEPSVIASGLVVVSLHPDNGLLQVPKLDRGMVDVVPLEPESEPDRVHWREIQQLLRAAKDSEEGEGALARIEQWTGEEVWKARGLHAYAERLREHGVVEAELEIRERIFRDFYPHRTETGIQIGVLSGLRCLELIEETDPWASFFDRFCDRMVLYPEPGAGVYWGEVEEALEQHYARVAAGGTSGTLPSVAREAYRRHRFGQMVKVRDSDNRLRAFRRLARVVLRLAEENPLSSARLDFEGRQWWVWHDREAQVIWGRPRSSVLSELEQGLRILRVHAHFEVGLGVADERLGQAKILPEVARRVLSGTSIWPPITVSVGLADVAGFYRTVERRRRNFSALIGIALGCVALGLLVLYRTFERQKQLMELRSNFVASVSHELRTPAASISLLAEELMDGVSDPPAYHRLIRSESQRLSALVGNVLDASRIERGLKRYEKEGCDLRALVEATVAALRPLAAQVQVGLDVAIEERGFELTVDANAIQRAFTNLIENGIKFSHSGDQVWVGLRWEGQGALFTVEDQGQGIPPEDQARVFEPFHRRGDELRRETTGVGLGLALAKHVVDGHAGKIGVANRPGGGSRFYIWLPWEVSP